MSLVTESPAPPTCSSIVTQKYNFFFFCFNQYLCLHFRAGTKLCLDVIDSITALIKKRVDNMLDSGVYRSIQVLQVQNKLLFIIHNCILCAFQSLAVSWNEL